jgi:hypothetical protein
MGPSLTALGKGHPVGDDFIKLEQANVENSVKAFP